MTNELEKSVSNREEIRARKSKSELPLLLFTLLGQMAAGLAMLSLFSGPLSWLLLVVLGVSIGIGGLISVMHLGTPLNAWRSLLHLRKSWLSREILFFGFFASSWLLCLFFPGMGKMLLALSGIGFVYCMAQVYRLRSIPAWDSWRTNAGFFVTALLLGKALLLLMSPDSNTWVLSLLLGLQVFVTLSGQGPAGQMVNRLRLGLIVVGFVLGLVVWFFPYYNGFWSTVPIVLVVFGEETLGRWIFYEELNHRPL